MIRILFLLVFFISNVSLASRCVKSVTIENSTEKVQKVKFRAKSFYRDPEGSEVEGKGDSSLTLPINVPASSKAQYPLIFGCMPFTFSRVEFYYKTKWFSSSKRLENDYIKF